MVGWIASMDRGSGSGEIQALAEIGVGPPGDILRRFVSTDILVTASDGRAVTDLRVGDFVLFHARDDGAFPRAVNVLLASKPLARVLAEERTLDRIDQIRSALERAERWQPAGPWLAQGIAVAGRLLQQRHVTRAVDLLDRAADEPSAGPRRGLAYPDVLEVHLLRAVAYIHAARPDEALKCLHEIEDDISKGNAFAAWVHLEAYLRSARFPCAEQGYRCLASAESSLAIHVDRPVFGPWYEIALGLSQTTQGKEKTVRRLIERSLRFFLELGARIDRATHVGDAALPPVLSINCVLPKVSQVIDATKLVLCVPVRRVAKTDIRYMAQKLLEREGGGNQSTSLGVIIVPSGTPEAWVLLRSQALDIEDVKFVATLMTAEDIPATRIDRRASVELLESLFRRISIYRNTFLRSLPVAGGDFFGRREEMANISQLVAGGNSVVVTGLRKTGKSSLLEELTPKLQQMGHVVVRTRCNSRWWRDTGQQLLASLEGVDEGVGKTVDLKGEEEVSPRRVAQVVIRVAEQVQRRADEIGRHASASPRLVVMIDEMDELLPGPVVSSVEQRGFLEFLAILRGYREGKATRASGVPLVIVGTAVREAPCTIAMWEDRETGVPIQNPLFQQVVTIPLPPFEAADLEDMARKHGREMQLEFDRRAVWGVYRVTGGLPVAARRVLGKTAAQVLKKDPSSRSVALGDFIATLEDGLANEFLRAALGHYAEIFRGDGGASYRGVLGRLLDLMDNPEGKIQPVPARLFLELLEDESADGSGLLVGAYHELVRLGVIRLEGGSLDLGVWGLVIDPAAPCSAKQRQRWWSRLIEELDTAEPWQKRSTC